MAKKDKMKVLVGMIDEDHQDSFWYDSGVIATMGDFTLEVVGEEIICYIKKEMVKYPDVADLIDEGYTDKDIGGMESRKKIKMYQNNWFEITSTRWDEGVVVDGKYTDAIKKLKEFSQ